MNFFYSIYSWFCDPKSPIFILMDKLVEEDGEDTVTMLTSSLPSIGITAAIISFVIAFAFYIWPINHPRFKSWWSWLIMLAVNAVINFGLAFAFISHRINDIIKSQAAMEFLGERSETEEYIYTGADIILPTSNWIDFALANVCVSILFFICASLILTWFSGNCRFSPFRR